MSVYRTPKSRFWQYDFVVTGQRFHGSTGQETKRGAEACERRLRLEAAEGKLGEASQLTLDQAALKWWAEVGKRRKDASDVERRVERLLILIGKNRRLADITTAIVNEAVEKRRGQAFTKSPAKDAKRYLPSNATVNRDVVETLRPILERARSNWDAKGLPAIDWKKLKLDEPRETVRIYSKAEQEAWIAACGPEPRLAVELMLTYGLRFGELFFPLDGFDSDGQRIVMAKGRKRDVPHSVPLRVEHAREIGVRVSRARAAGLDHIWFYEKRVAREIKLIAITYAGLESRVSRAADRAKIGGERRIHGARHHAGTAILRKTGNLKLAQKLLGHSDIKSTMRYAHALEEDLRAALDADLPRNDPGADPAEAGKDEAAAGDSPLRADVS